MRTSMRGGFTLIELLAVIAIIGILAAISAVAVPRVLERAKLAKVEADFHQLSLALDTYLATHGTYPPAYGYKVFNTNPSAPVEYHMRPYTALLGYYKVFDIYDRFALSYDTDGNGITMLEYEPISEQVGPDAYVFPQGVDWLFPDVPAAEQDAFNMHIVSLMNSQRPYVYLPVNKRQARRVAEYYWERWKDTGDIRFMFANEWDPTHPKLAGMTFPPEKYDAFVLIGVGPMSDTYGILDPQPVIGGPDRFHIAALRAYFLATRDANDNGKLDFDYRTRKLGEGTQGAYAEEGMFLMPSAFYAMGATFTGSGPGCLIFVR